MAKFGMTPIPWQERLVTAQVRHGAGTDQAAELCWGWLGALDREGCGRLCTPNAKGKSRSYLAQRCAWAYYSGIESPVDIGASLIVVQTCGRGACTNPWHLVGVARGDWLAKQYQAGTRIPAGWAGQGNPKAKLTDEEVIAIRSSTHLAIDELSERYGVTSEHISNILRFKRRIKTGVA